MDVTTEPRETEDQKLRRTIQEEILKRSDREMETMARFVEASTRQSLSIESYTRALEELRHLMETHFAECRTCRDRQTEYLTLRKETHSLLEKTHDMAAQKLTWQEKVLVPILTALLTSSFLLFLVEKVLPGILIAKTAKP